ncbi:centrosomal protein of 192 kDa [Lampris incognitus]|uniref:centrosomal protein of 192 kDa n=1 Tax=Lampris incognitus TaxID=2546036 RepID=UPI0024B5DFA0|nr:centrosomal protein of 192 kDa [Lampris incognitus]
MADGFLNLEEETFPSFLASSLNTTNGSATLENLTLGSGPGLPVAASTEAKIRAGTENRGDSVEASYLDGGQLSLANSQSSNGEQAKLALSFKDMDKAEDFIAAHHFSDMLVKIQLDDTESRIQSSRLCLPVTNSGSLNGRQTELGTDLSTGLLTFAQCAQIERMDAKVLPIQAENISDNEEAESDRFSGSVSSFLANEKLMSLDSMGSDITDDDIDVNNLPDDELDLYFNKLVPPAMQRGRVEGQEIPAAGLQGAPDSPSNACSTEPEKNRYQFLDVEDQEDFQMPDVRLAATGMDSCPASDEDTEDELEATRRTSNRARLLLPSTSRQLVGESNRPSFRPGLDGGSSDDEPFSGRRGPSVSGIEHRRSAEGQVINSPVTGDGGGGDGSSGSEESGNDGGVSTIPLPQAGVQTTYDVLRGLGIVGSSGIEEDGGRELNNLPSLGRNCLSRHTEMGDRVGPVGTGEASSSPGTSAVRQNSSPVNWSMTLDRQEALDAMDNILGITAEGVLDSVYLRNGAGNRIPQDTGSTNTTHVQSTQSTFQLSQMLLLDCNENNDYGVDEADDVRPSLGLRGGPCGDAAVAEPSDSQSEDENNLLSTSLEPKYFSQSFHQDQVDSDDGWNYCPDNLELEFGQGVNGCHSVVYQDEEGKWVTDLAYYSSFEKEVDGNIPERVSQFETEDFFPACNAIEKIMADQEEFEKEHQFMQEEQIVPASGSLTLGDTSWKLPTSSHILTKASQVSSEFEQANQTYLRLSLGEFFEQRSEALGCLGSNDRDMVKRPSFGYIITSPEKREPFPLIRPSDFASREDSLQNETMELKRADETLRAEDLDTTCVVSGVRMSPKGDTDPNICEKKDGTLPVVPSDDTEGAGSVLGPANQTCNSPSNGTGLMLSISTIASAIADASISSDPSQLAAMIMEVSKRSRAKNHAGPAGPVESTGNTIEKNASVKHTSNDMDQISLMDTIQRSTCNGELSTFDIEKYLRKADLSVCSDASVAHTTLDLTSWADHLSNSHRHSQDRLPVEDEGCSAQQAEDSLQSPSGKLDTRRETTVKTCTSITQQSSTKSLLSGNKDDLRRSSIPRPKASSVPTTTPTSARRSAGSVQSPTAKPADDKVATTTNSLPGDGKAPSASKTNSKAYASLSRTSTESQAKLETVLPHISNNPQSYLQKLESNAVASLGGPKTSPGQRRGRSGLPCLKSSSPPTQKQKSTEQQHHDRPSNAPEKASAPRSPITAPPSHCSGETNIGIFCQSPQPTIHRTFDVFKGSSEPSGIDVEETQCSFRPSTSPLTHSSPSQTSIPSTDGTVSSPSGEGVAGRRQDCELPPSSICSSPSLSRLTYISLNDSTVIPTPERQKNNCTMALSTTIIRASPTPPVEPDAQSNLDNLCPSKILEQEQSHQSKSPDPLPPHRCKSPEPPRSCSVLSCTRSQSECNYHCSGKGPGEQPAGCGHHMHNSESNVRQLTKVDSGYSSNLNIQQPCNTIASQSTQQWGAAGSISTQAYTGGGLVKPPSYSSEDLRYLPISSFKPQGASQVDILHNGGGQSLLAGHGLFTAQVTQQYLGSEAPLHPAAYHIGATGNGLYGISSCELPGRHLPTTSVPFSLTGPAAYYQLQRPQKNQLDLGAMGKPYIQHGGESWVVGALDELRDQVVVPEELRFPHACCVGIASQTSLSLFNPSERWQQVSITVTGLTIDGEKVDSLPHQWLIVKNKTIIGPKSTEEQKVLFIPPRPGVYQCVLSVSSWPASAEAEVAARAEVFAKRVMLVAVAENPALEVDVGKSGCLDFGDLTGGSTKSLPLRILNRTHATVPIRLVISANAMAWRCFTFSKNPVAMTAEGPLQAGHMTQSSSPSVINHVLHASYDENPESFMVWFHFRAPQKYNTSSGNLGPADEYSARVDIELDCPGPSHVIRSIPLRARSGTARVHAPKDLQTVSLSAALGKSSQQTLPLKNAGNVDVQLKLKISDLEDCFSVKPDELSLRAGEEQGIVVSFTAQGSKKCRAGLLTILVLPSGPQYEVALKGQVIPEYCDKPATTATTLHPGVASDVPPILSNKQFVAWGGVTLGRAVQKKLVLRNNSSNMSQQLRLLIRGQDQDCFQLQSMFSPEERLTRHGELSIRPKEDMTVHLLFAPTRVACMLAKLEIKQSGVRPSQPGVKFTIPLSGYGGTSNIILEDLRKRADGYVATLTGIAVGQVSKVCLCVRNTGSRAAFIKAEAYSDMQTRSIMDPSVISLSPSQFVLKARTQEVITVMIKSTQREVSLCQSANALLVTLCLFCGDEVSRQQYRRLLQSKPEAGKKVLSENSLLKNIEFNTKFLGEEQVTETYDLPQRPNEAQIFYGNMSKVVLSLMGSTESSDTGESDHTEPVEASAKQALETVSGFLNGNVSLDVLPVRGPQGLALRVAEPSHKAAESSERQQDCWSIHPEHLVLTVPTINGAATTRQVQIRNNTSRQLSFELSWPAHCLTITPQHGVIEPQCHLQVLISPNPSLATKSALLPWSGQIYVQCDGHQKSIKVQIRRDLALDVSAAPADRTLSALTPQAATPLPPLVRSCSQTGQPPLTPHPKALVEISHKTIVFPATPSREISEAYLEVENGEEEVRWYLSSFAPPYVKGVDNSGDVYRATYTAFRCSRVSGTLGAQEKIQVPITFLPRDRGDYAQFWDLECHPISEPQLKTSIRFQLCGMGVKSGPVEGPQEGDCSLVKTDATVKTRKKTDEAAKTGPEQGIRRGVYSPQDLYTFPATRVGESSTLKVNIRNNSSDKHELKFVNPREPFHIKHSEYSLRSQHYLKLPVQFKPSVPGRHTGLLLIQSETSGSLVIQLTGEALP